MTFFNYTWVTMFITKVFPNMILRCLENSLSQKLVHGMEEIKMKVIN